MNIDLLYFSTIKRNRLCFCLGMIILAICLNNNLKGSNSSLSNYYGFEEMETLKMYWGVSKPLIADMNQDGLNDLILVNNRKARIDILLQKKDFDKNNIVFEPMDDDVNDLFGKENHWRFKRVEVPLDFSVSSLQIDDLDRDGKNDLVYYTPEGLFLQYQDKSQNNTGQIKFPAWQNKIKIDISDGLRFQNAIALGDLNHDKKIDIALLVTDGVEILYQNKKKSYDKPVKHITQQSTNRAIYIRDVNNDQLNDMVYMTKDKEYPVLVQFQNKFNKLGPIERFKLPFERSVFIKTFEPANKNMFVSLARQTGRVTISEISSGEEQAEYPVYVYPFAPTSSASNRDIIAIDLDNDDLLDVVATDPGRAEFILYRSNVETGLGIPQRYPGFKMMNKLSGGAIGKKKRPAIIALSVTEKLIGLTYLDKDRLSYPEIIDIKGDPQSFVLDDIDKDSNLDLIYISKMNEKDTTEYSLHIIHQLATKKEKRTVSMVLSDIEEQPKEMIIADINQDGNKDILIHKAYGPLMLIKQSDDNTLEVEDRKNNNSGLVSGIYEDSMTVEPLLPKGEEALLLTQKNFARSLRYDDVKGWMVVDQYQASKPNSQLKVATTGQFSQGKDLQIFTYDSAQSKLSVLSLQDDQTYAPDYDIDVGNITTKKIVNGHFNSKKNKDLLICGRNKLIMIPHKKDGLTLNKIVSYETLDSKAKFAAYDVGDINNDKLADIVLGDYQRNYIEILTFDESGQIVFAYKFKLFEQPQSGQGNSGSQQSVEPRAITIGDVTGDGLDDLVVVVHDRIIIYPQDDGN